MKKWPRRLRVAMWVCLALVGAVAAFCHWVVPRLIVAEIRKHHRGHVAIRGWWVGRSSAGVTGLTLRESPSADSPAWATAERVTTDLTLGGLLRGRTTPRRLTVLRPRVVYRIGEDGRPTTGMPFKGSGDGPTPTVIAERGRLTLAQAGRPEMVVDPLDGRLDPDPAGATIRARSTDRGWGRPAVDGRFGPGFRSVRLRLTSDPLPADADRTARIPFVTAKVWRYFEPTGPVRVVLDYDRPESSSGPSTVKTVVDFERTRIDLPHLRLTALGAEGRMVYHDNVVRLDKVRGEMVGGRVAVGGSMDFHGPDSRYALTVETERADLSSFPGSWGLRKVGLAGRLTGTSRLVMRLDGRGLDVTGSEGGGTVEGASIRGIPLGRLAVKLRGEGPRPDGGAPGAGREVFSAQWLGSDFEVNDVELKHAVARVGVGEVPVSGRLGLRLALRMPLGTMGDLKAYRGEGSADLAGATIGGVGLGRLSGRVALADGVLDVADVRGRLVARPGPDDAPPASTEPPPSAGPLPEGGFRGRLRADVAAGGQAEAEVEGHLLPLDALAASAEGALSVRATARGGSLSDPRAWSGSGKVEGPEAGFGSTRFRQVSATLALEGGRLGVSDLAATLDGRPLTGRGEVDLAAPHAFRADVDGSGLSLADLLAVASPKAAPGKISGTVAARAEASGTLSPWKVESRGRARIEHAEAARVPIGDLPVEWETRGDVVIVTAREVRRYGGRFDAEARVPVRGGGSVEGTVTLARVDTGRLSAEVPGSLRLTGLADGRARFRLPMSGGAPPAEAEAELTSSKMTVEGIPAKALRATLAVHDGVPKFEARAEGLDGSFLVKGSGDPGHGAEGVAIDADVRAVGLRLLALWEALGESTGPMARVQGVGAVAVRVRTRGSGGPTHAEGSAEVRDLKWGEDYELGGVRAGFAVEPDCWRIGNLTGTLWESPILGDFWRRRNGHDPARYGLTLRLERASLARIVAFEPDLGRRFEGFASIRAQGHSEGSFRGQGEVRVEQGRFNQLPIVGLSIPVDWDVKPEERFRGTIRVRKAGARLAGGRVHGDATVHLGPVRDLHAEVKLEQIDLRAIGRAENRTGRPIPGRVDGIITLDSTDLTRTLDYTGRIDMDLTGASIMDIPILDGLDSALGSARGAVFDEGDLRARVAHRHVHVERLTLVGPLAQLHASGTIGFDGRLDLRAYINSSDILSENGQIAIGQISGAARDVRARDQAIDRMSDFLSSRLVKIRISGTVSRPSWTIDGSIHVDRIALAFFVDAMRSATSRRPR